MLPGVVPDLPAARPVGFVGVSTRAAIVRAILILEAVEITGCSGWKVLSVQNAADPAVNGRLQLVLQ
ncbi:hypothetical protein ACIBCT_22580 [Streptosporangium sp. NPDC050855]|uniref:hypothetical protein n=1 Tax=Streptosporangium sp. NPDC050855 TaxID=3366194 RepID=UPI00379CB064